MGESMFARLLEDLRSAEHFIFMEYFIMEEGHFWNSILEMARSYYHRLIRAGVEVYEYEPGFVHAKVYLYEYTETTVDVGS